MKQMVQNRIAIAIDKSNDDFNINTFAAIFPQSAILKIGLEYFVKFGHKHLSNITHDIFLDLKFFDIPNTVRHAVQSACAISNVSMLTIHAQGGKKMIQQAIEGRKFCHSKALILCVTKLTSESSNIDDIYKLTETALESGADGIVCSAQEIGLLREKFGNDFLAVTPGIRPQWYNESDDQVRTSTPKEAILNGSNIIVVGRPITRSENPGFAFAKIEEEIALTNEEMSTK